MTATTPSGAWAAIRARAEAQITGLPMYWPDESFRLPDQPAAFVYFEMLADTSYVAGFGSGRGANRYRNPSVLNAYVFVPMGWGLAASLTRAETVAAAFRSYRTSEISCFEASIQPIGQGESLTPPGLSSAAGNYACSVVAIEFFYDLIG